MLRSVLRGPEEIEVGCWVHVCEGSASVVAQVDEMAQLCLSSGPNVIRMWLKHARSVTDHAFDDEGQMYVCKKLCAVDMLFALERVDLSVMHCVDTGHGYSLRALL